MSEPIVEYRAEFSAMDFASKYAERVSRVIDEQMLANVEHQLARYGYVKVVWCRDCKHYHSYQDLCERLRPGMVVMGDGFCAWAERKEGGDD